VITEQIRDAPRCLELADVTRALAATRLLTMTGGQPLRVALLGRQFGPAWSPDGRWIACTQPGGPFLNVYMATPSGEVVRLRTVDPAWGGGVEPAWIRKL
jgi:hypothetical protein